MIILIIILSLIVFLLIFKIPKRIYYKYKSIKCIKSGFYDDALKYYDLLIKINNKKIATYYSNKAYILIIQNKPSEALVYCKKALKEKPKDYYCHVALLYYFMATRNYTDLIKYSVITGNLNSKTVTPYLCKSYAYLHTKEYSKLINCLTIICDNSTLSIKQAEYWLKENARIFNFADDLYMLSSVLKLLQKDYDGFYAELSKVPFDKADYIDFLDTEIFDAVRKEKRFQEILKEV